VSVPFVMVQLYVAPLVAVTEAALLVEFAQTKDGAVSVGVARLSTTMFAELPFGQPFAVALTVRLTPAELDGTSNVMLFVPWPLVSVAPVTLHENVALRFAGTDATTPVLPEQTSDGAVIVTSGTAWIGMETEFGLTQEPKAATTCTIVFPEPPAVNAMDGVPWPLVSVPLVTVHVYVAPLVAPTETTLLIVLAQTKVGAEMTAGGAAQVSAAGESSEVPSPAEEQLELA
jgi:hypothetical protein